MVNSVCNPIQILYLIELTQLLYCWGILLFLVHVQLIAKYLIFINFKVLQVQAQIFKVITWQFRSSLLFKVLFYLIISIEKGLIALKLIPESHNERVE